MSRPSWRWATRAPATLDTLLESADVVTLHVPETPQTHRMIGAAQLARMKPGAQLINASRGTVVDIDALVEALQSKHLGGAGMDVFPVEPKSAGEEFVSPLRGMDNVLLTPHVGGSTEEAQQNIGTEVAEKLIKYSNNGSTLMAVNFPEVSLPEHPGQHGCCTFTAISRECSRRSTLSFPKSASTWPANICKPTPGSATW